MTGMLKRIVVLGATVAVMGVGQSRPERPQPVAPPGSLTPGLKPRHAVALEAGTLSRGASIGTEESGRFAAGAVFDYFGDRTDTFGRDWHVLGAPGAWLRHDGWYAIPARPGELRQYSGNLSLISSLPPPQALLPSVLVDDVAAAAAIALRRLPLRVAAGWWRQVVSVDSTYVPEFGETVGLRVYRVPRHAALEAIDMLGGVPRARGWPEGVGFGQLHVPAALPLVFRYDGQTWDVGEAPMSMIPVLSLLRNPEFVADARAPLAPTGLTLPCWSLIGGLDPRGMTVGRLDAALPAPARVAAVTRRDTDSLLGLENLTERLSPVVPEAMHAPRSLLPAVAVAKGVAINDNSQRQAVYLEQALSDSLTEALRGRTVRLAVMARAIPSLEAAATATVGIELEAGSVLAATSATVGPLASQVALEVTIPEDATRVVVRLLPLDRSIAVQERSGAIFEAVSLVPVEWPSRLDSVSLLLRRVRVVTYSPALRYTRAPMAVSERPTPDLRAAWVQLAAGTWNRDEREAILAGRLAPGMSPDEVRLAWGEPEKRQQTAGMQRWDYKDRSAAFGLESGLISWTRDAAVGDRVPALCPGGSSVAPVAGRW